MTILGAANSYIAMLSTTQISTKKPLNL